MSEFLALVLKTVSVVSMIGLTIEMHVDVKRTPALIRAVFLIGPFFPPFFTGPALIVGAAFSAFHGNRKLSSVKTYPPAAIIDHFESLHENLLID